MEKFTPGPTRPIKCLRCKKPMELRDVAHGCFIGKCTHCDLEVRGAIGEYQSIDRDMVAGVEPYMTMISYPEDLAKDGLGPAARDKSRGKPKPIDITRKPPNLFGRW